ncbi:MAG TPA: glycoside hydrolase domain-containing protein, partial [Anaerolineales bacterium]|nr:glycoside hydrolase domain-containing protein [Anaerolineales bacterium]
VYAPILSDGNGLLVTTSDGTENALNVYRLQNSSDNLSLVDQVKLDQQPGRIALSILDAQNFVAAIPGTKYIVRMINGQLQQLENEDGRSASIVDLDMISADKGWGKSIDSRCSTSVLDNQATSVSCAANTSLLETNDGGVTWRPVNLPFAVTDRAFYESQRQTNPRQTSAVANGENTLAVIGQGFDRCEIPTLSQMQTWSQSSPYQSVNLYIGGINRACSNNPLNASYIFQMSQQGWTFFPTWVGPQAPCANYINRFSSDVTMAFQQGVDQANLAVERLAELALTGPTKTGSVVYYDMENYGTTTSCRAAVNAFMNGWVSQIRARSNLAGVYGSTLCNTGLSDFQNIANVPDVIWPARWYHNFGEGFYDPNANVWNLGSCLPNTAWANHQRIRQYEGDHNETWGNLTLNIDSNVLDGLVTTSYDYPFVSSIRAADPNPITASSVSFTVTFSKAVSGVNTTDFSLTRTGSIANASITSVTGSGNTYTVIVNTGSGTGTIRLDLLDNDSIKDAGNQSLGGSGMGNGNFTNGESYTISAPPNIDVLIDEELRGQYFIPPNGSTRESYAGLNQGPVRVTGTGTDSMLAALRMIWQEPGYRSSYSEVMGLPKPVEPSTYWTEYWFPWYNNATSSMEQAFRIANIDSSATTIDVSVGTTVIDSFSLGADQSILKSYPGVDNGPIHIQSTNGRKILASLQVIWEEPGFRSSYSELIGLPQEQLSTEYWFPWYNNAVVNSMDQGFRIANVDTTSGNTVEVWIGTTKLETISLSAGGSIRVGYNIDNGPARVVCITCTSGGNDKIIAALRVIWKEPGYRSSYSEMIGLPKEQLSTEYWFPWYNNSSYSMDQGFRVANVDTTLHTVKIFVGAAQIGSDLNLTAGGSVRVGYPVNNGPIRVVCTTCNPLTNDDRIIAALRVIWTEPGFRSSYSELMGLPKEQLSTEYWFPWYNNVDLDTQLRFGVP